jgi:fluoride exporter
MHFLWIGIGGFLGANARFLISREMGVRLGVTFPYGTLFVNILGSFIIGIVFTLLTDRVVADPIWRQFVVIGFLGGFTTFSSYAMETMLLIQDGRWSSALIYVLGNNVTCLLACAVGIFIARSLSL